MKCEAIYENSSRHSVRKMCKALELSEASYYQWLRGEKQRQKRRETERKLIEKVRDTFDECHRVYGCRRLREALVSKGIEISEWKVRRIMKENGIYPEGIRRYRPGKRERADGKYYANVIERNFSSERPNLKWAGDITYLKTSCGWVYLAAVMDLYNRGVVGYSISRSIDAQLTCNALGNALVKRGNKDKALIFHSDRGCQYCSKKYQKMLADNNIEDSMSKGGCPYDNSCMESFFASLKKECFYRRKYGTIEEIEKDLFYYIEIFYNRKRLHSSLGYMSPVGYRMKEMGLRTA